MFRFVLLSTLAALGGASYAQSLEAADEGIVGGVDARNGEFPYQLSLLIDNIHICGASLLKPNLALTAAHCTEGEAANIFKVRAGSIYYANGGSLANVVNKYEHPRYQGEVTTWDYDVAVLVLDRSLPLSAYIQTISLQPVGAEVPDGTSALVAGWGDLWSGAEQGSHILKKVALPKFNQQQCVNNYKPAGGVVTERMTCYGYQQGQMGTCQGDSGGPIVVNGRQTGIVSWSAGCGAPGYPHVFARISNREIASHIQRYMAIF